jgi:ribosomal protein L37E
MNDDSNTGPQAASQGQDASSNAHLCDRCGETMYEFHCRIICPRCGYQRDCSDP